MPTNVLKTRAQSHLARCVFLAVFALLAHAQSPAAASDASTNTPPNTKDVILNVTALDAKGHPVTDLTSADFQIFDDGKLQHIASFKASAAQSDAETPPATTLILFDLLNSIPAHRGYLSNQIIRALETVETGDSVYFYLLTNHGDLYPVHALPTPQGKTPASRASDAEEDRKPASTPWTRQIHPLLDEAIQKVYGLRPMDDKDRGIRSAVTFRTLSELGRQLTEIPGSKTIVWISAGAPNWLLYPYGCQDIVFAEGSRLYAAGKCSSDCAKWQGGSKCVDYMPFLQHFSAQLDRTGAIMYNVEDTAEGALPPADRGTPKDTLQQLADLTGGRMYIGGEVGKAIAQSLEDARARYQLVYDAPSPDGKYHKLRVACARKGVRIDRKSVV